MGKTIVAFGVKAVFFAAINDGKFGPFRTSEQAENCLIALAGKIGVQSAEITLIKKEDNNGRLEGI